MQGATAEQDLNIRGHKIGVLRRMQLLGDPKGNLVLGPRSRAGSGN